MHVDWCVSAFNLPSQIIFLAHFRFAFPSFFSYWANGILDFFFCFFPFRFNLNSFNEHFVMGGQGIIYFWIVWPAIGNNDGRTGVDGWGRLEMAHLHDERVSDGNNKTWRWMAMIAQRWDEKRLRKKINEANEQPHHRTPMPRNPLVNEAAMTSLAWAFIYLLVISLIMIIITWIQCVPTRAEYSAENRKLNSKMTFVDWQNSNYIY